MAWKKLADRLKDVPLILAGPILRRVIPNAVTVWIALKESATVELTVYDGDGNDAKKLMHASRKTTALGKNLHIVAVTARSDTALTPGPVYFYDLSFSGDFGTKTLTDALGTLSVPIVYPPLKRPSFALPPGLADLRLMHGSCRKPHGPGVDGLAMLDGLMAATAQNGTERPHQLLLTGDQIYADDVADSLLILLTDAGDTLLGWTETLPPWGTEGSHFAKDLPPYWRDQLLKDAGFTSGDRRSHLMSFGEWMAMYLLVWSDVLWPAALPDIKEIIDKARAGDDNAVAAFLHNFHNIKGDIKAVETFRSTIPNVRRVLANIPSYMICDDHEITDDWNMTRRFCDGVYGNGLGMRMVMNGLVAFSLCQVWGNVPEWFDDDPHNPPGLQMIKLLDRPTPVTGYYEAVSTSLMVIVGVHFAFEIDAQSPPRVYHEAGFSIQVNGVWLNDKSIAFNFAVEGPEHQVIVTDTRTWRTFPEPGKDTHPCLLPTDQIIQQLETVPPALNGRLMLVVVTTNMPPIATIRLAASLGQLAGLYEHDLFDSWEMPSLYTDRMIARMAGKLPKVGGTFTGQAVLLSGDVHHGFSSRLAYWADERLGDAPGQKQPAKAVFAQLVSSALNNQSGDTVGLHRDGYLYAPSWGLKQAADLLASGTKEACVGWNWSSGNSLKVGELEESTLEYLAGGSISGVGDELVGKDVSIDAAHPTIDVFGSVVLGGVKVSKTPDYHYRFDYLTATAGQQPPNPPAIDPVPAGASDANRKKAIKAYYDAAGAYRDYFHSGADTRDVVGLNNLGEITFQWGSTKKVYNTLRWQEEGESQLRWARYEVSLDPDDPQYPMLKADGEP